jgi:signal transduction histidine kinase
VDGKVVTGGRAADDACLDYDVLVQLCPFYLVLNERLEVDAAGDLLTRLVPAVRAGSGLHEAFVVRRPRDAAGFETLAATGCGRLALLEARAPGGPRLRGQFVLLRRSRQLLFFGAPAATSLGELSELGLSLQDFPAHIGLTDYLTAIQSQNQTLYEAKAMAERLRVLNTQLEQRVAERTRRLQAGHARLARYSTELEKMSERLQVEIAERSRAEAERSRMEEDLRLAHKVEAVGRLASGIAHEINTPVQFVGDNLRFLADSVGDLVDVLAAQTALAQALTDVPLDEPARSAAAGLRRAVEDADLDFLIGELPRAVAESMEGMERVGHIVRAMKDFAHPDIGDPAPTDLNRCVKTTLVVSRNEYRPVADLVTDFDRALPLVRCLPGEINQVVLNLVVNAARAIADRARSEMDDAARRGVITVTTAQDGDHAVIRVRDTGTGIAAAVRDRIFDPFFTTRDVGQGTGQGLSMCRSIVTVRHGGQLTFTTEVGVGTEFVVRLPLSGPPRPRPGPQGPSDVGA